MRRKDREIFDTEIEKILLKGKYGILATVSPDGTPYAVPISYAWKDGLIHLHCAANTGKKLENIAHCSDVCFVIVGDTQVQPEKFSTLYESVIVQGTISPSEDKQASLIALVEKYSKDFLEKGIQHIQAAQTRTGAYIIHPKHVTGKAKRNPTHSKL